MKTVKQILQERMEQWHKETELLPQERLVCIQNLWKYGFNTQEAHIFTVLTEHLQDGRATAQVPLIEINFPIHSKTSVWDTIDIKQLFDEQIVVWQTNKGVIRTHDCRNPETGRTMAGYLFMSAPYVQKHFELMYEVFCEANELTGSKENTVDNKKEFLALIIMSTFHKAPKGAEKLSDSYLQLADTLFPHDNIVEDRIKKYKII